MIQKALFFRGCVWKRWYIPFIISLTPFPFSFGCHLVSFLFKLFMTVILVWFHVWFFKNCTNIFVKFNEKDCNYLLYSFYWVMWFGNVDNNERTLAVIYIYIPILSWNMYIIDIGWSHYFGVIIQFLHQLLRSYN